MEGLMMANIQLTHASILNSSAQLLILPINNSGILLDPVLTRAKTLFADNYQRYYRACRDGSLSVGSCLLHKRVLEQAGLSISSNGHQPSYIANLVVSNHPYHPTRSQWLIAALNDLSEQLIPLIRYHGIRRVSLLARPLVYDNSRDDATDVPNSKNLMPLDWYADTLPLLTKSLQELPKIRIDIHLPKDINI